MNKFKVFLKESIKNVKDNILLVGLILTSVLNDFILRVFTVGGFFKVKPILTSIAIVLILSVIVSILSNKRRNYMYLIFSGLLTLLNISNYLYYIHFNSFISVGVFNQSRHLGELTNSIIRTLDFKVLFFLIPIILFVYIYNKLKNEDYFALREEQITFESEIISPLVLGLSLLLLIAPTLTGTDISRLSKQWNREYLVEEFGIYTFATADLIKSASVPRTVKADYGDFDKQLKDLVDINKDRNKENLYTNALEGKDLYVIHYESVQNFAMDLSFADGEVTPFLNQLSNESLFFNNFYPQHSVGTSSDSEFTFSTSLYPINNRTVFIDHADKEFITIQKLLVDKGYHTMSMHGNNGSFWNRDIMHSNLGYKEFLSKEDYDIDEEVGLGLSDRSFYTQSVEILKQRKQDLDKPIMSKLISLSNHYPFDDLEVYGNFDTGYLEGTEVSNYLKSMNYADQALELFFKEMDKEGLLDNAAVLIYGDHHANISKEDYELIYNYDEKSEIKIDSLDDNYIDVSQAYLKQVRKTPLLIWTKGNSFKNKVEEPIAMINVMPTLSNMLDIDCKYCLGQDIFNVEDNTIIFPDGSFLTEDFYYSASSLKTFDMKSNELLLKEQDFDQKLVDQINAVEKRLELSSDIIENNLITYYKNYN